MAKPKQMTLRDAMRMEREDAKEKARRRIFVGTVETPSFSFMALGHTEGEALAAVTRGLAHHAQTRNLVGTQWLSDALSDIQVLEVETGRCYRDREKIT